MKFSENNFFITAKNIVMGGGVFPETGAALPDSGFLVDRNIALTEVFGATAAAGGGNYAMFFGTTTGTGSTQNDYAATVAVKTSAGTGRVPFPQAGATSGIITAADSSSFTIPTPGVYHVTYKVHTTEPAQLALELQGAVVVSSETVNMNPTSGGHILVGDAIITTTVANSVIAIINPPGNAAALTITPADGNRTAANAMTLSIEQLGIASGTSTTTLVATETNGRILSAAASSTTVGYITFPIPRDYDEATDHFFVRVLANSAGVTNSPIQTLTLYRKRSGSALTTGTAKAGTALSTTESWQSYAFNRLGLKRDDVVTISIVSAAHTTDAVQIYGIEVVYRSTLVSYNEFDGAVQDTGNHLR